MQEEQGPAISLGLRFKIDETDSKLVTAGLRSDNLKEASNLLLDKALRILNV